MALGTRIGVIVNLRVELEPWRLKKRFLSLICLSASDLIKSVRLVFHFARIVPKRTSEHAQNEKGFINRCTSGCICVSNG
jgi:hypothetical protein